MRLILLPALLLFTFFSYAQYITHGPVVGGVTPTTARMYVRTHQQIAFTLELSTDTAFTSPLTFTDSTRAERDSSIITELSGLDPYTTYYYRLTFNGTVDSLQGSFKTFPNEGEPGEYTWAVLSCQEYGTYNAFVALKERAPELVLHTGDWTYPDYQLPNDHRVDWSLLQESYRKRYAEPKMPPVIRSSVFDYVVDNHDGIGARDNTPSVFSTLGDSGQVRNYVINEPTPPAAFANMMKAYTEFFPGYQNSIDTTKGMYHSYRYGNAEIFFVDVRNCGTGHDSTFVYDSLRQKWSFEPTPGQTLLGEEQFQWLKNGLQQSTADWKFIVSGVMFNKKFRRVIKLATFLQNTQLTFSGVTGSGFTLAHAIASNWCGYPEDQDGLLNFIDSAGIKDVIVLSGHVHTNVMDDGTNAGLPELNTGPAASTGPELTYYIDSVMQQLGFGKAIDSLWNGGGQGVENKNFKSGFGTIQIYGQDSVVLCTVDEDNVDVSCMTLKHSSKTVSVQLPQSEDCVIQSVFPNPVSSNVLNIRFCSSYVRKAADKAFLVDVSGKVFPVSISADNSIDLKPLASGKYILAYDYGKDIFIEYISLIR